MTTPTYTSPFTGTVVVPTDVSYLALSLTANTQLYWPSVVNPTQVVAPRILDVTPTGAYTVLLPDALQGAVGTDILIRNFGPSTILVTDIIGTQSVTLLSGEARYFYLADNTTPAGVWQNVKFGIGTSFADAASLAGPGLIALNGKLATSTNAVEIFSDPGITNANRAYTYIWESGAGAITLPAAGTLQQGWYIMFRNNGTGTLTITPQAPSQINSTSSIPTNPGDSGVIIFEKSTGNFFTVGLANPTSVTFTANTYDVDSIVGGTFSLVTFAPIIQTYVALSGTRTTNLQVVLPQITQIYILVNQTGQSGYNLQFKVENSLITPVTVTTGQVVLAFSDGTNLYAISQQSASGQFFANNGTASAPSFSFTSNNSTGMYLASPNVLGFSANGINLFTIDNSNPSAPIITANGQFNARLIASGTF